MTKPTPPQTTVRDEDEHVHYYYRQDANGMLFAIADDRKDTFNADDATLASMIEVDHDEFWRLFPAGADAAPESEPVE